MAELLHADRFGLRAENGRMVIEVQDRRVADLYRPASVEPFRQGLQAEASGRPAEPHGAEASHAHEKQRSAAWTGGQFSHLCCRGLRVAGREVASVGQLAENGR